MQRDDLGGQRPGTYALLTDSLVRAAYDVATTADLVREGTIEGRDDEVEVGHADLQGVLCEFTSRWQTGADALIRRQHDIADRLARMVEGYLEQEAQAASGFSWGGGRSGSS